MIYQQRQSQHVDRAVYVVLVGLYPYLESLNYDRSQYFWNEVSISCKSIIYVSCKHIFKYALAWNFQKIYLRQYCN